MLKTLRKVVMITLALLLIAAVVIVISRLQSGSYLFPQPLT